MMAESMACSASSGGPRLASISNAASHTPSLLQRVKRTNTEFQWPIAPRQVPPRRASAQNDAMTIRRRTVEYPFATFKAWMGSCHFLTKTLEKVKTEMSLQVLAYNMKRMINIFGVKPLLQAIAA
jgi:hypothetical protein